LSSTFFIFFEKSFYPLRRNGFSRFCPLIYTLYIRWVNPSIKKKFAFLSPYIYSIPYQYMFCQVLTVNSPKLFTVCTNKRFCNFLGHLCKTEKIGLLFCARCQPEDQRQFHFASWYKPLYSSLRSLTNGLYCKERSLTTVILQWFDFNRPL
jgi:hypothetical protein